MHTVIRIDMRLTDEHILGILRGKFGNQPGKLTLQELADLAKCHKQTAANAIRRLEAAGRLRSQWDRGSRPASYQVLEEPPPPP